MKKRFIFGLIMLGFVVAMFAAREIPAIGLYIFDVFIGSLAILCSIEMSKILENTGHKNFSFILGLYPSLMYVGHMLCVLLKVDIMTYVLVQLLILIAMFFASYFYSLLSLKEKSKFAELKMDMSYDRYAFKKSGMTLLGCLYPSLFFIFLLLINRFDELSHVFNVVTTFNGQLSLIALLFTFMMPIVTDSFSMFFGKMLGGVKLAPRVSPNKTVSGAVAGVIWSAIVAVLIYYVLGLFPAVEAVFGLKKYSMYIFAILGMISSIVCQFGDLFESWLKRRAGMKDSGDLLKSHGGFLDRLDSHIFNAPFTFIFFMLII